MSKVTWSVRKDGDNYIIIKQFTGKSGTSPWEDVARVVTRTLAQNRAEEIARVMNEYEARHNS